MKSHPIHLMVFMFFLALVPFRSDACRSLDLWEHTFLPSAPSGKAAFAPIIAKVRVTTGQRVENKKPFQEARVIETLKGKIPGKTIRVIHDLSSSCTSGEEAPVGQTFYIAGQIDESGFFRGTWKGSQLDENAK